MLQRTNKKRKEQPEFIKNSKMDTPLKKSKIDELFDNFFALDPDKEYEDEDEEYEPPNIKENVQISLEEEKNFLEEEEEEEEEEFLEEEEKSFEE
jgi:hypothetical protein